MKRLFTERHGDVKPRIAQNLNDVCCTGLLALIEARISEEWFGLAFPSPCEDGPINAGSDKEKMKGRLAAYNVIWPEDWLRAGQRPSDGQVFDLIEFSYEHIAEPNAHSFHSFHKHSHYSYDQKIGRARFEEEVNRMFERNGIAFELMQGEVIRIAPTGFQEALNQTVFQTGDLVLDDLLEGSRHKFLNRDLKTRRESLEKLWDAWERLKTLEPGKDKKAQAKALLAKASTEPCFLSRLESEAMELTKIGNSFMIRHTETDKIPINESTHVDYLFQRMFAIIRLLLRSSNPGG